MRYLVASIAAVCLVFGSTDADAKRKKKRTVMVLPLEGPAATGLAEAEEAIRDAVAETLPGYRLLPPSKLNFSAMQVATGCGEDEKDCLKVIGRTLGATQVVRAGLVIDAGRAKLSLMSVRTKSQKTTSYLAEMPWGEGTTELTYHVVKGLGGDPGPAAGSLAPYLASSVGSLEKAQYYLNGLEVPVAALQKVQPGPHRLEIRVAGFEPFNWSGRVDAFRPVRVAVRLEPTTESTPTIAATDPILKNVPPPSAAPAATPKEQTAAPVQARTEIDEEEESIPYIAAYVLGGGTLVSAGVTALFGAQYQSAVSDAEASGVGCDAAAGWDPSAPTCVEGRRKARNLNIGIGVTAGLAGATLAAFLIEMLMDGDEDAVPVALSVGPGTVQVSGSF